MIEFSRYDNVAKNLAKVADIADKEERREALRYLLLQQPVALLVQYAYHPDVEFDLPGPIPDTEWTPSKVPNHTGLLREARRLQHLTKKSNVRKMQKQVIFKSMIEVLEPQDVELLKAVVDKKLPWKTLNKSFVMVACPELFPPVE